MTTDQLLQKVKNAWLTQNDSPFYETLLNLIEAHKSIEVFNGTESKLTCSRCFDMVGQRSAYPCYTIKLIEDTFK